MNYLKSFNRNQISKYIIDFKLKIMKKFRKIKTKTAIWVRWTANPLGMHISRSLKPIKRCVALIS